MQQIGMQQNMTNLFYKKTKIILSKLKLKEHFSFKNLKEKIIKKFYKIFYNNQL